MNPKTHDFDRVAILLHQTRDAVHNARKKELSKYDLSNREVGTLNIIDLINSTGKNTTPAEIARWAYRRPHTIASILNRMYRRGFITRTKDLEYKNLIRIGLTEKGKQALNVALNGKAFRRIFSVLSSEECDQLISHLVRIRNTALEEAGDSTDRPYP